MIAANELRIGNFILNDAGTTVKLDNGYEIDYAGESVKCYPIPLTPEILVKTGAIRKPFGNVYFIGKFRFEVSRGNLVYFSCSGKQICIPYVHRLQNLIHSLTNTNLQFTL